MHYVAYDFELCIARISQCELGDHQLDIVNNLSLLLLHVEVIIYYMVSHHMKLQSSLMSWQLCEIIISLYNNCQYFTVCIIYASVCLYYVILQIK